MLKRYIATVLFVCVLWPLTAAAAPSLRYQADIHGDFVMIGGPLAQDCSAVAPDYGTVSNCTGTSQAGSADNFWRADVTPPTAKSTNTVAQANTTLKLTLPAGAVVQKAYVYWGGRATGLNAFDDTATISKTGTGAFSSNIKAIAHWTSNIEANFYQSVADVTTIIANDVANYGAGAYSMSNMTFLNFRNDRTSDYNVAGWWMIVFYRLDSDPLRNLALFDGFDFVSQNNTPISVTLSGFEVPNAGFDGKLGVVTMEGDDAAPGDSLYFGGNQLGTGTTGLNPNTNFFNGSRTNFDKNGPYAVQVTGDLPRLTGAVNSQSGMDLDVVDVKNYLTIGQKSVQISATSSQDTYLLSTFVTSIATYEPNFTSSTLTAVDVNGPPLLAGDILEYTGTIVNKGNDASLGTVLRIPLPAMVNDVSGSLQIVSGANAGAKTDANDTDQGQYDSATRTIYFNLGTGATGAQGGRMAIGDTAVVRFRVQVMPGFSGILDIQASIGASGELGAPQDETPTDGNDNGTGVPPTEVIVDECVTNANCSSPEPLCNTAASPKSCVQCLTNSDCSNPTPYCVPATHTCATCSNPTTEVCDGLDNDCDGQIDEGFTRTTFYKDADGDGFGDPANTVLACTAPSGYVANSLDCNDANAAIKPGATEICDGVDNNCDGQIDEYLPLNSYYRDADGDGYGNSLQFAQTCSATPPAGYVSNSTDCNDADNTKYRNLSGYADADSDTYTTGSAQTVCSGSSLPSGWRAAQNGNDCNDTDNTKYQNLNGYVDADHDGYGTGTVQVVCSAASLPTGYAANSTDCNDADNAKYQNLTGYADADGDTYTTGVAQTVCSGASLPSGYRAVQNGNDCNDSDNTKYQNLNGYVDADNDGYGAGSVQGVCSGASLPTGYSANSTDCNDADTTRYQNLTGYVDADGDTYTVGNAVTVCSGAGLPTGYKATKSAADDCNDSNVAVHPGATEVCNGIDDNCDGQTDEGVKTTYYQDSDGDGYGNAAVTSQACSVPAGYVANSTDCNDADTTRYQNLNGYTDADHDGYGTGSVQVVCSGASLPTGYAANSTDCNDADNAKYQYLTCYVDADGDTYTVGNAVPVCSGASLPSGYRTAQNGEDCNDADNTKYHNLNGYTDADHDSYGTGSVQVVCSGASLPLGYSVNNTDCNDGDYTRYQDLSGYADADGDTYTAGGAQTVCSGAILLTGYRAIQKGEDCDDSNAAVHPGATEVCNGIDDNCIGGIDENLGSTTCGVGACQVTVENCVAGMPQTCSPGAPAATDDTCDGIDNNCNGQTDEGYVAVTSCFLPGACAAGNKASTCVAGVETGCQTGTPAATDDTCDGIDNNCNGQIDEGYVAVTSCFLPGACAAGNKASTCVAGVETGCQTGTPAATDDTCDGIDNNCNGQTDEGYVAVTSCFLPGACAAGNKASTCVAGVETGCQTGTPAATDDTCDGIDNNCNGQTDEGYVAVTSCFLPGACAAGNKASTCVAGVETGCQTGTPAATDDTCDGIDNNCNGQIDEGYVAVTSCFLPGACAAGNKASTCVAGVETGCQTGTPAATDDTCDGIDNNCNGQIDEGSAQHIYYRDADGDGFGDPDNATTGCAAPVGYVDNITGFDCNDTDPAVHPGAAEVCNGIDDNCNSQTDEGVKNTYYQDADGDGYGNAAVTTQACSAPAGYVADFTDCDDTNASVNPGTGCLTTTTTTQPTTTTTPVATTWEDFAYTESGGTITIIGYAGSEGFVVIPSVIEDKPVVRIGDGAFYDYTRLLSIIIPNSVTSIADSAFQGCKNLASVTIPASVTSIGDYVFSYCPVLTNIDVEANNLNYSSQDGVLYNKDKTTIIQYPGGKAGVFAIPGSVTTIEDSAFEECVGLTSVTIGSSVVSIGDLAFYNCTGLVSVTIPASVTSIGDSAFNDCTVLTSIDVAASNPNYSSQDGVLYNKDKTTIIQYPGGKSGMFAIPGSVTTIEDSAFEDCIGLTDVTIGNTVVSIGDFAFFGCTSLISVTIPASVTSIGYAAFVGCTGLTSIDVDANNPNYSSQDGVLYNKANTMLVAYPGGKSGGFIIPGIITSIGPVAFYDCTSLTSVTIPSSVTSIEYAAFVGCTDLTNIDVAANNPNYSSQDGVLYNKAKTALVAYPGGKSGGFIIPGSITSVGDNSFLLCTGLTSVTIPGSITSIRESMFYGCTGLTSVTIPDSVTSIGRFAFNGCTSLTSVSIPGSVTSIGHYAFLYCTGLTSIIIPGSVTSIGWWSFDGCTGLTAAYFYGNAPTMGTNVFLNPASSFTVYYTSGSTGFTNPWYGYGYPTAVFTPPTTTTTSSIAPTSTTTTVPPQVIDTDGDGVPDDVDNCPNIYNPQQLDADDDGIGDVCDLMPGCGGCGVPACEEQIFSDVDHDNWADEIDNCPNVYNPQQHDANHNGIGDCCDPTPGCGGDGQPVCDAVCTP